MAGGYAIDVLARLADAGARVRRVAWLTAFSVAVACAAVTVPARMDHEPRQSAPQPTAGLDTEQVREVAGRILAEVARARNLEVLKNVQVDVIDREGIRAFARKSIYEHTTPQELVLLGSIEASLGVLPRGVNPERVLLDLLEEGVLGLYDPKAETLFIGDFVPKGMLSMVVGHELAHGLQDMHFDLEKNQLPIRHQSDAESARRFLIEGGAQAAYLAWVSGDAGLGRIDDAVLDAMGNQTLELAGEETEYPILARTLRMPYADGTATVIRLVVAKGWAAVDQLYADLPASTEQMLHVDKLLSRETPRAVEIDAAGLHEELGLERVWHDTLGEAALLAMLAQVEPSPVARRAAAGWGGDFYVALRSDADAPTVVAAVAWDSVDDAKQFEQSFAKYLAGIEDDRVWIERKRDRVMFATGLPENVGPEQVSGAAWAALTVGSKS